MDARRCRRHPLIGGHLLGDIWAQRHTTLYVFGIHKHKVDQIALCMEALCLTSIKMTSLQTQLKHFSSGARARGWRVFFFSFFPLHTLILYPGTTTGDLLDVLIPTNSGISNMGGPAGNKIPDHDGVNAALNGVTIESHTLTHVPIKLLMNTHTHIKSHKYTWEYSHACL